MLAHVTIVGQLGRLETLEMGQAVTAFGARS